MFACFSYCSTYTLVTCATVLLEIALRTGTSSAHTSSIVQALLLESGHELWRSTTGSQVHACGLAKHSDHWCVHVSAVLCNAKCSVASGLPYRVLLAHGSLTVLLPYVRTRIRAHALSQAWPDAPSSDKRRKAWELLTRLESTHSLLGLLNFVAFLWDGRYVSYSLRFRPNQALKLEQLPHHS